MKITKGKGMNALIGNVDSAQSAEWSLSCLNRIGRRVTIRTMMNDFVLKKM
jgi:hypothetical protein